MIKDVINDSKITTFTTPEKIALSAYTKDASREKDYFKGMLFSADNSGCEASVNFIMN